MNKWHARARVCVSVKVLSLNPLRGYPMGPCISGSSLARETKYMLTSALAS